MGVVNKVGARSTVLTGYKGTDYIVLNDASALSAARASVTLLGRDGSVLRLRGRAKEEIAEVLVGLEPPA